MSGGEYDRVVTDSKEQDAPIKRQKTGVFNIFYDEDLLRQWEHHNEELKDRGTTNVFESRGCRLTDDSGFADVQQLFSPSKCLTALLVIALCIGNLSVLVRQDWKVLNDHSHDDSRFLLTHAVITHFFGEVHTETHLSHIIPACEIIIVVALVILALKQILLPCIFYCCCKEKSSAHFLRWFNTSLLFHSTIPYMSTFSAMKLLYYVTPSVIYSEAYQLSVFSIEDIKRTGKLKLYTVWHLIWFAFSRLFCLIVGFDAFIVKFRMAEDSVNSTQVSFFVVLNSMLFAFQVLSIVNLRSFTLERLFFFIFAGEDGKMQKGEEIAMFVWISLLDKQVFEQLGPFKAIVALLAFNDYSFQLLVLEQFHEDVEESNKRESYRRQNTKRHCYLQ